MSNYNILIQMNFKKLNIHIQHTKFTSVEHEKLKNNFFTILKNSQETKIIEYKSSFIL